MSFLDLLFPKKCFGCNKSGIFLCKACAGLLPRAKNVCPYCGYFSFRGRTHPSCVKKLGIDGIYSVWDYSGIAKDLILSLKYRFAYALAKDLSLAFVDLLQKEKFNPRKILISPVPLHKNRERWRGFNHARILCGKIAEKMSWDFVPCLITRTKSSQPQVGLRGDQRKKNVKGVFAMNHAYQSLITSHQSLIIFDDVFTTGSTLKEIAKILKKAGVKKVWGLTLAT